MMSAASPEFLDRIADRLAGDGQELEAEQYRACALNWRALEAQVADLQRENTAMQLAANAARKALAVTP